MSGTEALCSGCAAGCSALAWHTGDGRSLWGRNYDFDRLAEGSGITFLPRGTVYAPVAAPESPRCAARYACGIRINYRLSPEKRKAQLENASA